MRGSNRANFRVNALCVPYVSVAAGKRAADPTKDPFARDVQRLRSASVRTSEYFLSSSPTANCS